MKFIEYYKVRIYLSCFQGGMEAYANMKHSLRKKSVILIFFLLVSLLFPTSLAFAENVEATKIVILHTNDTHARVLESDNDGMGFAKLAEKVKAIKEENPNVLLLDAGDILHGLPFATISKGESIVKIMNAIKYDAMAPGNHDFNYGYERLVELKELMDFPMISANVYKDGKPLFTPYIIKEVGGVKIGIFGLTTPETSYKTNPKNVVGLEFKDPAEIAESMVKALKDEDADFIIALAHLGIDEDSEDTSKKVAENVNGIDVIIDGHSHSMLESGLQVGDCLIAQTGEYIKNIGIVEVEFEEGKVISKKAALFSKEQAADLQENTELKEVIDKIDEENNQITSVKVGETAVKLDGERENARTRETNLGNLITSAVLEATGADVALTNGGGIRASIEAGEITTGDIIKVLPFGNYVVTIEAKGQDIVAALEHGTSSYPDQKGAFPQVAGITYTIDLSAEKGSRVIDVKVGGEPIDPEKIYKLATNDFIAAGGDEYTMFKDGKMLAEFSALNEILESYIKELGIVNVEVEGRITVKEVPETEPAEEPEPEPVEEQAQQSAPPAVEEVQQPAPPAAEEEAKEQVAAAAEDVYVVKPDDVLWKIAEKFQLTWQKLAEYNKLKNPHLIMPGQKLLIPAS